MLNIPAVITSLVVLSVLAIVLNSLCLWVIRVTKSLKNNPSSQLVANLLGVHLFQGIFVFPLYAGKKAKVTNVIWNRIFFNGFRFTYMLSFYGTCLGVLSITLDRFLATFLKQHYKTTVTMKRVVLYLLCLWVYIIALCIIPFIDSYVEDGGVNGTATRIVYYHQTYAWTVFMLSFNAALPYVIIISSYVYITVTLKKLERIHSSHIKSQFPEDAVDTKKKEMSKYKQIIYFALVLAIAYFVFWVPSIVYYLLEHMCKHCFPASYQNSSTEKYVGFTVKYLAFLDSVAAPTIYCFYHTEFKNSLVKRFQKTKEQTSPKSPNESTALLHLTQNRLSASPTLTTSLRKMN